MKNCSAGVAPVVAKAASIAAQASVELTMELFMTSSSAANNTCTLALYDSQASALSFVSEFLFIWVCFRGAETSTAWRSQSLHVWADGLLCCWVAERDC